LVLITGVEAVLLDYGRPTQRRVTYLDAAAAERHLADGQFPEGSMGPKMRAATRFVRHGGRISVITTAPLVERTLHSLDPADQSVGTRIVPVGDRAGAAA
jgi:carbamate kinase